MIDSKYHPVVAQILELLKKNNFWFEKFEHEPVRTSEEAAKIRDGYTLQQGAKALIIRIKISNLSKKFVMLVIPGDARFDEGKVGILLGSKSVRFATEKEVSELTNGVQPGGIPPFGNLFGIEVVVDTSLLKNEKIVFNAGDKRISIAMLSKDYQMAVNPVIADVIG